MARYVATIEVPKPLEETFEYLSDFANTRDWDPGVVEAEPLVEGPVDVGSLFRVVARFLGRDVELRYEVTAFEPPKRVVLEAHSTSVHSLDEIRFEATAEGTRITYDANLQLKGFLALADPLLGWVFQGVGDKAVAGLRAALGG